MTPDPYEPYLRQADDLFAQGQMVKAGQIWQAILKQQPTHRAAREHLLHLKELLVAQQHREEAEAAPESTAEAIPEPEPMPPPPMLTEAAPSEVADLEPPVEAPGAPELAFLEPPSSVAASTVPPPAASTPEDLDPEHLLAEGCTLYDMGQLTDALQKWEQVLALDPNHALARSYANGVRKEQGLPPLEALQAPAPTETPGAEVEEDLEKLLKEAVQLYDMGLVEEAISKWERVRVLAPEREEVAGYLQEARKELGEPSSEGPATPRAAPTGTAEDEALALKLRQAEHLLSLQRHEEAAFTFQQALDLAPGHPAALAGLEHCRKPGTSVPTHPPSAPPDRKAPPTFNLDPQARIAIVSEGTLGGHEPGAVALPASLSQTKGTVRRGLAMPKGLDEVLERLPWLKSPKVLAITGGTVLVLGITLSLLRGYLRDRELERAVAGAKTAALAPLNQQTQVPDLAESPSALRDEIEATLVTDPLRAYLRAETLVARLPADASAAQLLEKARTGLPGGVTGASLQEYQRHLQNGDLEAASKVMDALLRSTPGDGDLRNRAARLCLLLCSAHVGQGKWEAAAADLQRGRALFPDDRSWQARLHLLERIQAMPKNQQPGWIPLLG